MKSIKLLFGSVLMIMILFTTSACQKKEKKQIVQKQEQPVIVYDTSLQKGVIIPDVKTRSDSTISYALYLPPTYKTSKNWPVVFCFDAQSRGKLPLELYKELAEKYGYILIGSNNSRNGVDWSINKEQIKTLINDVFGRIAIDQQRLFTMGFSGGARVACLVAIDLAKIKGVIGCAAGFPQLDKPIDTPFWYIGFSGDEDFNRVEMIKLDESLNSSVMPFYIGYFKGKHDWPSVNIMNDGFLWLEFNAYKNNISSRNENFISDFKKDLEVELVKARKTKNIRELNNLLKKGIVFLNNLTDISAYNNELSELEKSGEIQKIKSVQQEIMSQEVSKQEEYRTAMTSSNLDWWKKEVNSLNNKSKNNKSPDESALAKRLLNYISLLSNMSATNAIGSKQKDATSFFLTIYGMVNPKNPDYFYMAGYFFAQQGNIEKSISFLRAAVKYGYKDKKKLMTDATFDMLRTNKEFEKIVNEIKE